MPEITCVPPMKSTRISNIYTRTDVQTGVERADKCGVCVLVCVHGASLQNYTPPTTKFIKLSAII